MNRRRQDENAIQAAYFALLGVDNPSDPVKHAISVLRWELVEAGARVYHSATGRVDAGLCIERPDFSEPFKPDNKAIREALADLVDAVRNPIGASIDACLQKAQAALTHTPPETETTAPPLPDDRPKP